MKDVNRFLSLGTYTIAGVSRDPKSLGRPCSGDLRKKGMDVVPVNPAAEKHPIYKMLQIGQRTAGRHPWLDFYDSERGNPLPWQKRQLHTE